MLILKIDFTQAGSGEKWLKIPSKVVSYTIIQKVLFSVKVCFLLNSCGNLVSNEIYMKLKEESKLLKQALTWQ